MRQVLFGLAVVGIVTTFGLEKGFAQQRQLRPVTMTYRSTPVTQTQWSPDSAPSASSTPSKTGPSGSIESGNASPGALQNTNRPSNEITPGFSSNSGPARSSSQMLTNQQLQNPSGGFNITHAGMSQTPGTISPNNYFGSQYNNWSNLYPQPQNLSPFESFNRYQPDANSGGYYSPNNYTSSMNNQWSNLSTGFPQPNDLGGWSFGP